MNKRVLLAKLAFVAALAIAAGTCTPQAMAAELASEWVTGFNNQARLIAGRARAEDGEGLFAGIEIAMPAGWKTYWKAPGEAGGIPPEFDFSQSENLAKADVLYPAPHRLFDKAGASIGYKDRVVFPVRLTPKDPAKAIGLKLKAAYGVCKELCVPAEADIALTIPAAVDNSTTLVAALDLVPRTTPRPARDPVLSAWHVEERNGKPVLRLEVADAGSGTSRDAFAFGPDGLYLPLAQKTGETVKGASFTFDLTDGVDIKDLRGKPIGITLVGATGQSQATIVLP